MTRTSAWLHVECQAPDLELLLVNWLNAIVYEMATRGGLFGRFSVTIQDHRLQPTHRASGSTGTATSRGRGERRNPHQRGCPSGWRGHLACRLRGGRLRSGGGFPPRWYHRHQPRAELSGCHARCHQLRAGQPADGLPPDPRGAARLLPRPPARRRQPILPSAHAVLGRQAVLHQQQPPAWP